MASSAAHACLPPERSKLTRQCTPESQVTKLLNVVFGELSKPRQIAVVAGVSRYSNLPRELQLPPADYDIESFSRLLIGRLSFDEVIVLKDKDFNKENIEYIFGIYLPGLLSENDKSRVLFAYSGHGADYQDAGYLFFEDTKTIAPSSYDDLSAALDMN